MRMLLGGICVSKLTIDELIKEAAEAHKEGDYIKEKKFLSRVI